MTVLEIGDLVAGPDVVDLADLGFAKNVIKGINGISCDETNFGMISTIKAVLSKNSLKPQARTTLLRSLSLHHHRPRALHPLVPQIRLHT
ncbi:uncharacterized protein FFB14_07331 [Fusarium fujikuroi]|nr:uncharacterized protein FFB14_07331 [Fusarium fujikuroi]